MKTHEPRQMPHLVLETIRTSWLCAGLRRLIECQWLCVTSYDVGDTVQFDPGMGAPYYPPSMPFKNATGVVTRVMCDNKHGRGPAQGWAVLRIADGREFCAPMCWLTLVHAADDLGDAGVEAVGAVTA